MFVRLAASLCLLAWAAVGHAQYPAKTIAQYSRGEIRFTQGGKVYSARLSEGRLDVAEELTGESPLEIRTLHLHCVFLQSSAGSRPDVTIVLKNTDGPGTYGVFDLLTFEVQTSERGLSAFRANHGTCTFVLTRLDQTSVEGTAQCAGEMTSADGTLVKPVTDVTFGAAP